MSSIEHEIVSRLYRTYNARDLQGWLDAFAPDSVWRNVPTGESHEGRQGQERNYHAWSTPFPNGTVEDLVVRAGDGFAVAEFTGAGVHEGPLQTPDGEVAATGRASSIPFCDVHLIEGGLIVETRRYWDLAGAAAQLGLA